jgi:hypothetical protein
MDRMCIVYVKMTKKIKSGNIRVDIMMATCKVEQEDVQNILQ